MNSKICLILIAIIGLAFLSMPSNATTISVCSSGCDYSTINSAITGAIVGDTIEVRSGNYPEFVDINKRLNLTGIPTAGEYPHINPSGAGAGWMTAISAQYVNVSNFIIENDGLGWNTHAMLVVSDNNNITSIVIRNTQQKGLTIGTSKNNTITNITTAKDLVIENHAAATKYNIIKDSVLTGTLEDSANNNTFLNNQIAILKFLVGTNDTAHSNNITNIYIGNIATSNGILVYNNRIVSGISSNVFSKKLTWNITKTLGTNIMGNPYLGGNFFDNYGFTCLNTAGDYICDMSYNVDGFNIDYLSLAKSQTTFDPSGYVKDPLGTPVYNAKVVLQNNTWIDPCVASCFSDSTGFWNTDIYANGNYNFNVSKAGYTTQTGTQAFTIGGVNNNFTLQPAKGTISGHVYTTINSTGSLPIRGDVDRLKKETTGSTIASGGTITVGGSPDGNGYIIQLIDVDSSNQQATLRVLKNGVIFVDTSIYNEGQLNQIKIEERTFYTTYLEFTIFNIFQGGEINSVDINAGYASYKKTGYTFLQFLLGLLEVFSPNSWGDVMPNLLAWTNDFTIDGSNQNGVTFNASKQRDVVGSQIFDVTSAGNIYNFYVVFNAKSETQNAGKLELGYTDDGITAIPAFTDTLFINNRQIYRGTTLDFKSLDADNDKKIRVWFKFAAGYSPFTFYEFYINALGATTLQPLIGASVFYNQTLSTLSTSPNGEYLLLLPLGNNTIVFSKVGYETKNVTHWFNNTHPTFSFDVTLNLTNRTTNTTSEYIRVDPNPVTSGQQAHAFFRTLDHTSLFGGYSISVCPLIDGMDCDIYNNVPANSESSIPLNSYGVGEYQINLVGFLNGILDPNSEIIVTNNFTVISSTPSVNWGSAFYYLGESMVLTIYVPSGSQVVTVLYPNGSILYNNSFSASSLLYNRSFATNSNFSLNTFPPGNYRASITGGNVVNTELRNQSSTNYTITSPVNVAWGSKFNIEFRSPRTSTLYITNNTGQVLVSVSVSGNGNAEFDTRSLSNQNDVLTIKLIRGGNVVAQTTTTIGRSMGAEAGDISARGQMDFWTSMFGMGLNDTSRFLFAIIVIALTTLTGFFITKNNVNGGVILGAIPFIFFALPPIDYLPRAFSILYAILIALKIGWFK